MKNAGFILIITSSKVILTESHKENPQEELGIFNIRVEDLILIVKGELIGGPMQSLV